MTKNLSTESCTWVPQLISKYLGGIANTKRTCTNMKRACNGHETDMKRTFVKCSVFMKV